MTLNRLLARIKQFIAQWLFLLRPKMIFEQIKKQAIDSVPFAKFAGVEIVEVGKGESVATLVERAELTNHIGTMHAAAMFALGEAASGAAMAGALGVLLLRSRPVASQACIKYLKPANGTIIATAKVQGDAQQLADQLEREGKVKFDVLVQLSNPANEIVSELTVEWHIKIKQ
jgi:acyl-coenzyme A thioesterase PaaI-like protein